MIAPHIEDDEDAVIDLPLLVQSVAGNTPENIDQLDETENATITSTTSVKIILETSASSLIPLTEPPNTSTTTKRSFLLPITG